MTDVSQGSDHPTRANIIEALQWLVDGAAAGDTLFIHFSGHGEAVRDGSGDEEDGKDEALVPIDGRTAGLIADDVLHDIFSTLPRGVTLYCVFDCCHSGTMIDLPKVYDESTNRFLDVGGETMDADVVMISGCLNDQKAGDLGTDLMKGINKSVGALSNALYGGLFHRCRIAKGYTWQSLITEIRTHLRATLTQIPQLEASRSINPDELAFSQLFQTSTADGHIQTRSVDDARVSKRPRANSPTQLPPSVVGAYRSAGKKIAGWRQMAKTGQLKRQVMGIFGGGRKSASKKKAAAKPAAASRSVSADSDYSDYDYSDDDGDYSDDYSDYSGASYSS
jgi:hypothetical protein